MTSLKQLQQQFNSIQSVRQPVRKKFQALIGHPDGSTIDDPEHAGYVFIRIDGDSNRVRHARCRAVLPRYNQPVIVAYSDERPGTLEVIDLNDEAFPPNAAGTDTSYDGSAQLGKHAAQHAMFGGDTTWIDLKQIVPLRTRPDNPVSMQVYVESGPYQYLNGYNYWPGGLSSDMTAQIPSSALTQIYRIIYINPTTNALAYINSAEMADDPYMANYEGILDLIPVTSVPLSAVRLHNGMTTITETDIYDLRAIIGSAPGTVSGSGAIALWSNVLIVAGSGGDYTTIQAAINAASSGQLVLVAPGTYAENDTLKDGVAVKSLGVSLDTIIAPASGVSVAVPAGSHRLHGFHLTPPAGQVALSIIGATGDLEVFKCFVGSNGTNAIDTSTAGAAFVLTLSDSAIDGSISTKAQIKAFDCEITGNIAQVAGAGDIILHGGKVQGNITHVAGATIYMRNLPTITGTVSGTGTVVGPYRDGSGNVVMQTGSILTIGILNLSATSSQIVMQSAGITGTLTWTPATSDKVITLPNLTGTLALGAGTLTVATANSVAVADHTHAITSSSSPGAAAAILASTAAGYLQLARLGIGISPGSPIHVGDGTALHSSIELGSVDVQAWTWSTTTIGLKGIVASSVAAGRATYFLGQRARGTLDAPSIVSDNDLMFVLLGSGYDGAAMIASAEIVFAVDGTPGINDMPGRISFFTTPDGSATFSERVRITADGGLGIVDGIAAPATLSGFAKIYVDSADGDLKVKFGDGIVKTIVVDT